MSSSPSSPSGLISIDLSTRSTSGLIENASEGHCDSSSLSSGEDSNESCLPRMFRGVKDEYARRCPHFFSSDYEDFLSSPNKTVSASTFMFFATIFSTIALGAHLSEVGDFGEYMGVGEFLIMNAISGLYFSFVSCQPLMILRPTGPITLIIENIILISEKYAINFWHLQACTGFFVGIWMTAIAAFEGSNKIGLLTRFTHEIFACFVCSIYIFNGVNDVVSNFHLESEDGTDVFGPSLFMAVMAVMAFSISLLLSTCSPAGKQQEKAEDLAVGDKEPRLLNSRRLLEKVLTTSRNNANMDRTNMWSILSTPDDDAVNSTRAGCVDIKWNILNDRMLSLLNDYAVTVAVVVVTVISFLPLWCQGDGDGNSVDIARVRVPSGMNPTMTERTWWVSFGAEPYDSFYTDEVQNSLVDDDKFIMVLMALAISIPVVFFFYIDQNLSCILSQAPHIEVMKGGKGTYIHSPFLCVALSNMIAPSFGLPFVTASLPHSPQFVHALAETSSGSSGSSKTVNESSVSENRVAPLLVYSLIGLVSCSPSVIRWIPLGAVRGVLAYVGFAGILNTELYQRLICILKPLPPDMELPSLIPDLQNDMVVVSFWRIHYYTFLQIFILGVFWVINLSPQPAGLLVAFAVAALGPVRIYLLPHIFCAEELILLDS